MPATMIKPSVLPYLIGALTFLIFLLDTFTPLRIAIAVLYGAVIMIASPVWSRSAIIKLAALCLMLTVLGYAGGHTLDFFGPAFGRCAMSMIAIVITTFLALRGKVITQRLRDSEETLRQANHRKDEFLAMLAHELRNPLAPISAGAHLLKMSPSHLHVVEEVSDIIIRQTDHLNGLINDLLDVSRLTRRVASLKKERVDMKQVVSDAAEQVRPLIENLRHHFEMHVPPEPAIVFGDYKRLVQVVANLLNNAAKYTPEGGALSLHLTHKDHQIVLEVCDTGIGISPDMLPQVFELFTQAERNPDRAQGGLGIGLALVRALVELHGGNVTARSNRPRVGTTFTITLNAHEESKSIVLKEVVSRPTAPAKEMRLLIVDDNADAADVLARFLRTAGHEVDVCYRPTEALDRARLERYNAFILDIGLPEMDGNVLARRLRHLPQTASAYFIALTGYGEQFNRQTAMRAGFDHYLVKPANPIALLRLLAQCAADKCEDTLPEKE
jgi:signal transduction histidine kinase/ActR/RegA family two-component response regulator